MERRSVERVSERNASGSAVLARSGRWIHRFQSRCGATGGSSRPGVWNAKRLFVKGKKSITGFAFGAVKRSLNHRFRCRCGTTGGSSRPSVWPAKLANGFSVKSKWNNGYVLGATHRGHGHHTVLRFGRGENNDLPDVTDASVGGRNGCNVMFRYA